MYMHSFTAPPSADRIFPSEVQEKDEAPERDEIRPHVAVAKAYYDFVVSVKSPC